MKVTPWPMNTSSSTTTPSQMKVWLEPCTATDPGFFDLHERADLGVVPDGTTIEIGEGEDLDPLAKFHIGAMRW